MRYSRLMLFKCITIALGALLLATGVSFGQVTVSLPNVTGQVGSSQTIPVTVGDLTGQGVISYQFTVTFDPSVVTITNATTAGTLSSGVGQFLVNSSVAGRITVGASGTSALTGSGTLLNLSATLTGKGTSALTFSSFQFNEGNPAATITNGSVVVPTLAIALGTVSVTAPVGGAFTIPVTTEDLTGKNVLSYEFTVNFDATKVKLTSYSTTGTLSSAIGSIVVNTSVSGQLKLAAAGTASIAGAGTLINLTGEVVSGGTSAVTFSSVKFNEGTPSVAGVAGSVTVGINTKPTFVKKLADTTVAENQALSYTYTASDAESNPLTFSGLTLPTGASLTSAGVFSWTPSYTQSGTHNFKVVVSDGQLSDTAATKVTVTNVNRKPMFNFRTPATLTLVSQNRDQAFVVSATDPDGDALTFTWKVNGVQVKTGADSTYTGKYTDPHNTLKSVIAVFSDASLAKDSTTWDFRITDVERPDQIIPTEFALGQNYPNPFNPATMISYDLPKEAPVTVEVYNVLGIKIRTLLSGEAKNAGRHNVSWDGRDDVGVSMPTGVYLYRINAGSFQASKKMTLLK